jgi:hypothetical protein
MKTIYSYFKVAIATIALTCFTSCSGFLDMEPSNSSNADNAIATTEDAQVIINGIMRSMTSSQYYGRNFFMYGDAKGGDLTIAAQGRGLDAMYTFNHSATSGAYSGFWEQGYYCIMQVNNLLKNIAKIENQGTTGFDSYKGQALTLRAMMYFDLVRLYGLPYNLNKSSYGVPLVLETLDADAKPTRASVEEVYKQILADLTAGATLLSSNKATVNGYIGYYGNIAEQARVKLYMEDYDGALSAAEEIINSGKYKLYTPANWTASWGNQFGTESIFELGVYPNEGDLDTSSLGFYLMREGQMKGAAGWFMASDYYLTRLGEDDTDVRWSVMAQDESESTHLGSCYKYMGGTSLKGDGKASITAVNIKVIRLSEIYLIAAEAALHASAPNTAKAASYLNAIRCRAPKLASATASTVSDDMILDERSKELFGEGQRFFDLIRKNKSITYDDEFGGITVTQREKTINRTFGKIVLPISQDEINANPALKDEQNEAYK